jgi:hypothetical protein
VRWEALLASQGFDTTLDPETMRQFVEAHPGLALLMGLSLVLIGLGLSAEKRKQIEERLQRTTSTEEKLAILEEEIREARKAA